MSLFSGIGGIDLSAEWADFTTVGQCEIDDYAMKILKKNFPGVEKWRDIHDVTIESFRRRTGIGPGELTLLSGGFPCQPHSLAGKRKASADKRDLWAEFARVIREIRPKWVLGENVPGLRSSENGRYFGRILRDMDEMGYNVGWCSYGAVDVGAPHKRERVFFVAYADGDGLRQGAHEIDAAERWVAPFARSSERREGIVPDADKQGLEGRFGEIMQKCSGERLTGTGDTFVPDTVRVGREPQRTEQYVRQGEPAFIKSGGDDVPDADGRSGTMRRYGALSTAGEVEAGGRDHRGRTPEYVSGERWTIERGLGGVVDGLSDWLDEPAGVPRLAVGAKNRADRLRCLGNAVVPAQIYPILTEIAAIERGEERTQP